MGTDLTPDYHDWPSLEGLIMSRTALSQKSKADLIATTLRVWQRYLAETNSLRRELARCTEELDNAK